VAERAANRADPAIRNQVRDRREPEVLHVSIEEQRDRAPIRVFACDYSYRFAIARAVLSDQFAGLEQSLQNGLRFAITP
jgi:hypothetical protein